mmetsp:Transcript_98568/g.278753  ORF Transcript_98568/g.278753 Transcript_98568/m.278753 type:complete len:293 (-) Transcript_98568:15-893(-)
MKTWPCSEKTRSASKSKQQKTPASASVASSPSSSSQSSPASSPSAPAAFLAFLSTRLRPLLIWLPLSTVFHSLVGNRLARKLRLRTRTHCWLTKELSPVALRAIFAASSASLASSRSQASSASSSRAKSRSQRVSKLVPRSSSNSCILVSFSLDSSSIFSSVSVHIFMEIKYLKPCGPANSSGGGGPCCSATPLISRMVCKPSFCICLHSSAVFLDSTLSWSVTTNFTKRYRLEITASSRASFASRCSLRLPYTSRRTGTKSSMISSAVLYFFSLPSASKRCMFVVEMVDRR